LICVGEHQLANTGPLEEPEDPPARRVVLLEHLGAVMCGGMRFAE